MAFLTKVYLVFGDEGEIETNRFFRDSSEFETFLDKRLLKYDDLFSIYYTGNIYRYIGIFKRVNRSERGRGAHDFKNILEYEGEN